LTIDELFATLEGVASRRPKSAEWVGALVDAMVRSDVEVGETADQWLLAESLGRYQIVLTRFFAFGEPDDHDLLDVGVSVFLSRQVGDLDIAADVGIDVAPAGWRRLPTAEWAALARDALLHGGEPAIRRAEAFGGPHG
jgi:hypothetical protein